MQPNYTKFYSFLFLFIIVSAQSFSQNFIAANYREDDLFAGIDIGSKGVKLSIIKMGKNASVTGSFVSVKDTSINTDFISFTQQTFHATLYGIRDLYNYARQSYRIPTEKIFTVVSSGIKGQAEKENKQDRIVALSDSLRLLLKEPKRVVTVIGAMDEAILSHLGIVPESRRYNTFLIDIGSGNTKGGYFKNGNTKELKLFMLNWGTKTISNATEKRLDDDKSIANYKKQLNRVLAGDPNNEIVHAVNESGAYNMNDNFAFSGGIAWAVATLLYPELADNSVVPLKFEDLVALNERLATKFSSITPIAIAGTVKDKTINKQGIKDEVTRVQKVFDQKALMAGTSLLLNIVRQFEGTQEKKNFFLVKNGQVGWISAYVTQSVNSKL
jgi:hypothetical protein